MSGGNPAAPPSPPPVRRLNRVVLLAAAAVVTLTSAVAVFVAVPRPVKPAAGAPVPRVLTGSNPGFLQHPAGELPVPLVTPTEEEYLRRLMAEEERRRGGAGRGAEGRGLGGERGMVEGGVGAGGGGVGVGDGAVDGGGVGEGAEGSAALGWGRGGRRLAAAPVDARREAYLRALRAPLVVSAGGRGGSTAGAEAAVGEPWAALERLGVTAGGAGRPGAADAARAVAAAAGSREAAARGDEAVGGAGWAPAVGAGEAAVRAAAGEPVSAGAAGLAPGGAVGAGVADALWVRRVAAWPRALAAGTVIPAVLLTEVVSEAPGEVVAQVSRDVRDAAFERVVVPRGTRLLGRYDSQVRAGQQRLLVAWTRLVFPDGSSVEVPALPGTSEAGAAGLAGSVDNHTGRVFGDALLLSLLTAAVQLSQPQAAGLAAAPSAGQVAAGALGQEMGSVGLGLVRREAGVPPTLRLPMGTAFLVYVRRDLLWEGAGR